MVRINNPSHIRQVLILGILGFLGLGVGPTCSLALNGRRLLEGGFGGALQLLHWSHPEAPHHIPGLSFTERLQLSVQKSRERAAALSSGMQLSAGAGTASVPAPEPSKAGPAPEPSGSEFIAPVYNLGFEYASELSIGTPPGKYSVLVDTGSDLVWVGCVGCDYCQPAYDPSKSSTYAKMPCADPLCVPIETDCPGNNTCDYEYDYGSGDTAGVMSYESVTLSSTTGTTSTFKKFAFGCASELDFDLGDVDGLVGLGKGPLSLTTQLGKFYGNVFSYCLVSAYDSNTSTSPLLFGDAAVPAAPVQYTPIVQNQNSSFYGSETFYYIGFKGINVNGVPLDIPAGTFDIQSDGSGGTILDSGTTITFFDDRAYTPLLAQMGSLIKYTPIPDSSVSLGFDLCYNITDENPTFPTVTFVLDGFSLDLPPDNVFLQGDNEPNATSTIYCLTFADAEDFGFSIFGNLQQQNFQIIFDRDAERFGFAPAQCDKITSG